MNLVRVRVFAATYGYVGVVVPLELLDKYLDVVKSTTTVLGPSLWAQYLVNIPHQVVVFLAFPRHRINKAVNVFIAKPGLLFQLEPFLFAKALGARCAYGHEPIMLPTLTVYKPCFFGYTVEVACW